MSSATKPTILFVPGAWHRSAAFGKVASLLESAGYTVRTVELASVGAPEPLTGFEKDVEGIKAAIESACADGSDVLLFMHSYGGIAGCEAAKGMGKMERRKEGKTGGVSHLSFCCAFAISEGASLMSTVNFQDMPWWGFDAKKEYMHPITPEQIFYNDLSAEEAEEAVKGLESMQYGPWSSKVTYAAWRDLPSTYLFCEKDQAIPIEAQRGMVQEAMEKGKVEFRTESLDAGHSPFLSMPRETAEAVRRAAGETL